MNIELHIGPEKYTGELYDNPVADQIARKLPWEADFSDFGGQEKLAHLDEQLSLAGVPEADAPQPGEIGYFASEACLVLYYASPGRWPGLVRVGRFDYELTQLQNLPDGTRIRITAVQQP